MAFNHEYPYVDPNMFNDDWLLNMMKQLLKEFENFINLNKIKYADPILWDITRQYEVNTIVIDPQTGDAHISTKAVPYGVALSNTNYWTKIYNYANTINILEEQIAAVNEELSTTATAPRSKGDLVWLNGYLYKVTSDMIAGDSYVVNSNCVKTTIEEELQLIVEDYEEKIGKLSDLATEDKTNLVAAINEVLTTISTIAGSLDDLNTTAKTNLVAAINEVLTTISTIAGSLDDLNTTAKTNLVAAINEVLSDVNSITIANRIFIEDYGAVGDGVADDTQAFKDAIAACPTYGTVCNKKRGATYKLTSTVALNDRINFVIDGQINYYGAGVCIDIMPTLAKQFAHCYVYIKSISDANGNSSTPASVDRSGTVGIRINNMISSFLIVNAIQRFTYCGMLFNTNGDIAGGAAQQICLHNYISILEVANCGFGVYMISADAATSCTQANEVHINWLLQCFSCLVVDETSSNLATDSNLFLITAIDNNNASGHGVLINGRWNLFKIAFMSTDIYFDTGSGYNRVEIGNNISTDVTIYYGGTKNTVVTANPSTLPEISTPTSGSAYQNTYGVPVTISFQLYSKDGTNAGTADISLSNDGVTWDTPIKAFVPADTTSTNRISYSILVPAGYFYKIGASNATIHRAVAVQTQ